MEVDMPDGRYFGAAWVRDEIEMDMEADGSTATGCFELCTYESGQER